jgi:hypothetical protein
LRRPKLSEIEESSAPRIIRRILSLDPKEHSAVIIMHTAVIIMHTAVIIMHTAVIIMHSAVIIMPHI